jgi:hypothetical protein
VARKGAGFAVESIFQPPMRTPGSALSLGAGQGFVFRNTSFSHASTCHFTTCRSRRLRTLPARDFRYAPETPSKQLSGVGAFSVSPSPAAYPPCTPVPRFWRFSPIWRNEESITYDGSSGGCETIPSPGTIPNVIFPFPKLIVTVCGIVSSFAL